MSQLFCIPSLSKALRLSFEKGLPGKNSKVCACNADKRLLSGIIRVLIPETSPIYSTMFFSE